MNTSSKGIVVAIWSLVAYGLVVIFTGIVNYFIVQSIDTPELVRSIVRFIGSVLGAYLLYKRVGKVYWFVLIVSGVFTILGILGLVALISTKAVTFVSITPLILSVLFLAITFFALLGKDVRARFIVNN